MSHWRSKRDSHPHPELRSHASHHERTGLRFLRSRRLFRRERHPFSFLWPTNTSLNNCHRLKRFILHAIHHSIRLFVLIQSHHHLLLSFHIHIHAHILIRSQLNMAHILLRVLHGRPQHLHFTRLTSIHTTTTTFRMKSKISHCP